MAKRDYVDEIEYFGVYCPETGGVYLVPIRDVPLVRQAALRVETPRNGQQRLIRAATRYEVGGVNVSLRRVARPQLSSS
jgi:PD-(D/E)XK endonuclease